MAGDFDFFSNDEQPQARSPRRARPETAHEDEEPRSHRAKKAKKWSSPLLIGGIVLGTLPIVGGAIAVVIIARDKGPEQIDKSETVPVAVTLTRPAPPVAKTESADATSPSPAVVNKVKKATVRIEVAYKNGKRASGSGFVERDSRLVLTNAHVVGMLDEKDKGPEAIFLIVNSGEGEKEYTLGGELLTVDKENDLALIRPFIIEIGNRHVVPDGLIVPRMTKVVHTQKLFVFGFPLGDALGAEISVRPTTVTAIRKDKIQVEGGMTFGNSGGPVVDVKGNVVGVAVSGIKGESINFATPGDRVQQLLARYRKEN